MGGEDLNWVDLYKDDLHTYKCKLWKALTKEIKARIHRFYIDGTF